MTWWAPAAAILLGLAVFLPPRLHARRREEPLRGRIACVGQGVDLPGMSFSVRPNDLRDAR